MKIVRYFLLPLIIAALAASSLDAMKRKLSENDRMIRFAWDQAAVGEYLEVPERVLKHSIALDLHAKSYEKQLSSNSEYVIPTDADGKDLLQAIFDCLNIIDENESEDQAVTSLLRYIDGTNYPPHGFAVIAQDLQIATLELACKGFSNDLDYIDQGSLELQKILDQAMAVFEQIEDKSKHAIIFDVDDTTLSNKINLGMMHINDIKTRFPYLSAIKEVLKFYQDVVEMGFKIFFLTARVETTFLIPNILDGYEATESNLIDQGYHTFEQIICVPYETRLQMSAKATDETGVLDNDLYVDLHGKWKEQERNEIAKKYTIAGTLDDIEENLTGNVGHAILIPKGF